MSHKKHGFFKKLLSGILSAACVLSTAAVTGAVATTASTTTVSAASTSSDEATPFSWDNASVYFLLTDRFCNGDTSNDHSYGRGLDKSGNAIATGTPYTSAFFMGGDFAGITKKLNEGYFDDLGVNAIWLSAPYEQIHGYVLGGDGDTTFAHYSYHGYYVLDYTETDKNFGTKEEFKTLVDTAHEHGIRIVMDIVMNHAGYQSIYDMNEFGFGSLNSGWEDYYYNCANGVSKASYHATYINYDDSTASVWGKWWGDAWIRSGLPGYSGEGSGEVEGCVASLPDFKTETKNQVSIPDFLQRKWQKEGTYDAKIAKYGSTNTVTGYISDWLAEWVREYGVDGFRCDTAKHVRNSEWKTLKEKCVAALKEWKQNNPDKKLDDLDFWMTGECWGHKLGKSAFYTEGGFDSMINFEFAPAAGSSAIPSAGSVDATYSRYASEINSDPSFNALSYLASHDTTLAQGDRKYAGSFLLMLPGGIQIYYGDETNRPMMSVPSDSTQGAGHMYRSFMNWDSIDNDVLAHWQKVGQFRRNHIAVGAGQHITISGYDSTNGYTFARTYSSGDIEDKIVATLFASPNKDITIDVSSVWSDGIEITNFYDGTTCKVSGGKVTFNSGANGTILMQEPQGKKGKVIVTHINKDTNETIKVETMQGLLGDSYTTSPLSTDGYKLASKSGPTTGTYSETEANVTYYYTFDSDNYAYIVTQYVDAATGAEIAESDTTVGKIGTTYTTTAKSIKNYEVDETLTTNSTGKVVSGTTTVVYKYNYVEPTNLQVHYYNANSWASVSLYAYSGDGTAATQYTGKWPGAAMTAEGNGWFYGEADTEEALVILNNGGGAQEPSGVGTSGYEASGEVWIKDGKVYPTGKVNVKYVTDAGKVLATEVVKGMADGTTTYTTEAKTFSGYTLSSTPTNAKGTFTSDTISVVYLYKSDTPDIEVTSVSLNKTSATVSVGATVALTATVAPSNATDKTITWSSSNTAVAKVSSSGVVTGVKAGTATITASSSNGKTAKATITVKAVTALTNNSTISATSIALGQSLTLKGAASGGTSPYTYAVYYKKTSSDTWTLVQSYASSITKTVTPLNATTYTVRVKAKDKDGTIANKDFTVKVTNALTNNSTISATSIALGNSLTLKGAATGGTSPYTYAVFYKQNSQTTWTTVQGYASTITKTVTPKAATTYTVRVKVKDKAGTIANKDFTVKVTKALENNSTISATSIALGQTLTLKGAATGGTSPYTYAVFYKQTSQTTWTTVQGYASTISKTVTPKAATTYTVRVKAKDKAGTIVNKDFTVKVTKPLVNNSTISATAINLGQSLTLKGAATGGTSPYTYAVFYKQTSQTTWTTVQSYASTITKTITPKAATTYTVRVKAKDKNGTITNKDFTVKVTKAPLVNNSTISATSITLGKSLTLKGAATGGTGTYTYAVYYKKTTDTSWTAVQSTYASTITKTVTPKAATTYTVRVKAKDSSGTIANKDFKVTVAKALTNASKLSATTITLGNTITVNAAATGGSGFYNYAVFYRKAGTSSWTTVQSYQSNATITVKPQTVSDYEICVKVKDSDGAEVKTYYTVTVNKAPLANNSKISATSVSKGTKITITGAASNVEDMVYFKYEYKLSTDSSYTVIKDYTSATTATFTPTTAGTYTVRVTAQDMYPSTAVKTFTVKVS